MSYWKPFTSLAILVLISILFDVVSFFAKKKEKYSIAAFFQRAKTLIRWNLMIMLFCTNFDGIILFSSLQFRNTYGDDPSNMGSLFFCLFFYAIGITLPIYAISLVRKYQILQKKFTKNENSGESDED